jgi:hypothetical protein
MLAFDAVLRSHQLQIKIKRQRQQRRRSGRSGLVVHLNPDQHLAEKDESGEGERALKIAA